MKDLCLDRQNLQSSVDLQGCLVADDWNQSSEDMAVSGRHNGFETIGHLVPGYNGLLPGWHIDFDVLEPGEW